MNGVYVYPDWSSCVTGSWLNHNLEQGQYCTVTRVCVSEDGALSLDTEINTAVMSHVLTYSPPAYHHFGVNPLQMDPFENNTVEVRSSVIEGEGLFSKRLIKKGELVSFYSGLFIHKNSIISPINKTANSMSVVERNYIEKYTLQLSNETSIQHWHDMAVDIPPRYKSIKHHV